MRHHVAPSGSPPPAAATAAAATAEVTAPATTAAATTAEVTARALADGAGPRRRGALPACEAAFAIATHLGAIADALESLRLSRAVSAPTLVRTNLSLFLAELTAGGPPCLGTLTPLQLPMPLPALAVAYLPLGRPIAAFRRTVACSQLPMPLCALPVAYLPLVLAIVAFRPHVGALEITSYPLGTAMSQLLPATFGSSAEGFARITAGAHRPVEFLLAHRIAVLHALAVLDVVLPRTAGNVCPIKVVVPIDVDVHVPTSPVAVSPQRGPHCHPSPE
jgi:hypothetical protein